MSTFLKIILTIGLLVFTGFSTLLAGTSNDVLVRAVHTAFNLDTSQFKVEVLSDGLRTKDVTAEELTVTKLHNATPLGRFTVLAEVRRDGEAVEKRQLRLFIHKLADVAVIKQKVGRFHDISEEFVSIERRDITNLHEKPVTEKSQLTGMRARRNLMPGSILTSGDIEAVPVVSSHSEVHIIYSEGLIRITSQGRALQDGQIGDYIKVQNKSSGKTVIARVIDSKSVAVDP